MDPLLFAAPWLIFGVYVALTTRLPRHVAPVPAELRPGEDDEEGGGPHRWPMVSVVVPARNEAHNIEACVGSLSRSDYPLFEIIVVDDHSDDGTGDIARALPLYNAGAIRVIEGADLPQGWLGKPWACQQGADAAEGQILLFVDADTVHEPALMASCVETLREDRAQMISLVGRQLMETFWEYLVQPQIFFVLSLRYPNLRRIRGPENWDDAIANGQFIMVEREAYQAMGGHGAVRSEVVEDLRFAQTLCLAGYRLTIREAEDLFATRMYRSAKEIIDGWGKNLYVGSIQAAGAKFPRLARFAPAGIIATLLVLWVLPTAALLLSLAGVGGAGLRTWSLATYLVCLLFWVGAHFRFKAPLWVTPLHALGAAVAAWIVLKSWMRGTKVSWKGREYRVST